MDSVLGGQIAGERIMKFMGLGARSFGVMLPGDGPRQVKAVNTNGSSLEKIHENNLASCTYL